MLQHRIGRPRPNAVIYNIHFIIVHVYCNTRVPAIYYIIVYMRRR